MQHPTSPSRSVGANLCTMRFHLLQRRGFQFQSHSLFHPCETVKQSAATSKPLRIIPNSQESYSLTNPVKL